LSTDNNINVIHGCSRHNQPPGHQRGQRTTNKTRNNDISALKNQQQAIQDMATSRQASKFKAISHEVLGLHQKVSASNPQFRTRKTKKTSLKLLFDDF